MKIFTFKFWKIKYYIVIFIFWLKILIKNYLECMIQIQLIWTKEKLLFFVTTKKDELENKFKDFLKNLKVLLIPY